MSAENERTLEINEGIASYAGIAAAADSEADAIASALEALAGAETGKVSFARLRTRQAARMAFCWTLRLPVGGSGSVTPTI